MENGEKLLIESCINNKLKEVKTLHQNGFKLDIEEGWCIDIAGRYGYSDLAIWLIENGISHKIASNNKLLAYACTHEDLYLVNYLINSSNEYKNDKWAFSWTATKGNIPIGELLIGYLNQDCLHGAIVRAAEAGKIKFLEYLILNSIQNIDESSKRAVYWAAEKKRWEVVDYLLSFAIGTIDNLGKYKEMYLDWKDKN